MQQRIHASYALTLSLIISVATQAQTGDAEIDPMDALFNLNESAGASEVQGQSCYDYLDRKGWSDVSVRFINFEYECYVWQMLWARTRT